MKKKRNVTLLIVFWIFLWQLTKHCLSATKMLKGDWMVTTPFLLCSIPNLSLFKFPSLLPLHCFLLSSSNNLLAKILLQSTKRVPQFPLTPSSTSYLQINTVAFCQRLRDLYPAWIGPKWVVYTTHLGQALVRVKLQPLHWIWDMT